MTPARSTPTEDSAAPQEPQPTPAPELRTVSPEDATKLRIGLFMGKVAEIAVAEKMAVEEFLVAAKILIAEQLAHQNKSLEKLWIRQLEKETKERRGRVHRERVAAQMVKNLPATLSGVDLAQAGGDVVALQKVENGQVVETITDPDEIARLTKTAESSS